MGESDSPDVQKEVNSSSILEPSPLKESYVEERSLFSLSGSKGSKVEVRGRFSTIVAGGDLGDYSVPKQNNSLDAHFKPHHTAGDD